MVECLPTIHIPGFNPQSVSVCHSVNPPAHTHIHSIIQYYKERRRMQRNVTEKIVVGFKTLSIWGFDQRECLRAREAVESMVQGQLGTQVCMKGWNSL